MTTAELAAVRRLVWQTESLDIGGIRDNQLERRVRSFARRTGFSDVGAMLGALRRNVQLRQGFIDGLTINVTNFFRNAAHWDYVRNVILPQAGADVRMWSAGCSIGAEPYTMSMVAAEAGSTARVLATDIDRRALQRARAAVYAEPDLREAPSYMVERYFDQADEAYRVKEEIRRCVRFQRHDLLADPLPPGSFHLIACRNVVIYFERNAKRRLHASLASALRSGGVLFTGGAERVEDARALGLELLRPQLYRKC